MEMVRCEGSMVVVEEVIEGPHWRFESYDASVKWRAHVTRVHCPINKRTTKLLDKDQSQSLGFRAFGIRHDQSYHSQVLIAYDLIRLLSR